MGAFQIDDMLAGRTELETFDEPDFSTYISGPVTAVPEPADRSLILAKGRVQFGRPVWNFNFQSRRCFVLISLTILMVENLIIYGVFELSAARSHAADSIYMNIIPMLAYSAWDIALILLIAYVMTAARSRQSKTA